MSTYIKINSINYPAEIYGHVHDREWDNRESKVIVLALTIQEALDLFVNGLQWSIVYGTQIIPQDDFIIAGPITDNRNGTVSVRMGKPTAAEVSSVVSASARPRAARSSSIDGNTWSPDAYPAGWEDVTTT